LLFISLDAPSWGPHVTSHHTCRRVVHWRLRIFNVVSQKFAHARGDLQGFATRWETPSWGGGTRVRSRAHGHAATREAAWQHGSPPPGEVGFWRRRASVWHSFLLVLILVVQGGKSTNTHYNPLTKGKKKIDYISHQQGTDGRYNRNFCNTYCYNAWTIYTILFWLAFS
jgi:hypothetical protein